MAAPSSFIYDLGKPVDVEKAKKASPLLKSPPGEKNFAYARLDSVTAIIFKNGKLRIAHEDGTKKSLEKSLPTTIPKIQKLISDIIKAAGISADAGDIVSNGKAEEEAFEIPERSSLKGVVSLQALQAVSITAPEAVLGEYQRDRVSMQAGDSLGRALADGVKDKKTLSRSIADFMEKQGIGLAEVSEGSGKDNVSTFTVRESAFAYGSPPSGKPLCGFIRGLIRGAYAAFFKSESVNVVETRCWGTGSIECEFTVRQLSV